MRIWLTVRFIVLCILVIQVHTFNFNVVKDFFSSKSLVAATIFACSSEDYVTLFKIAATNHMYVASGSSYLNQNSSFPHLMRYPYHTLAVYLDYTCDFGKRVLLESSNSYILNISYVWLIRINSTGELDEFENVNFGLDSDVTLVTHSVNDDETLDLIDLYKVNSTTSLISTSAGLYNNDSGLVYLINGSIVQRRYDFNGITYNTTLVVIDLNINELTDEVLEQFANSSMSPELDSLSRCGYVFLLYLMELFNFTVTMRNTPSFGYAVHKGPVAHNGEIGDIESRATDFGATPCKMEVRTRMDVARFIVYPLWKYRLTFMFRHPRTLGTYKALLIPFSTEVWITVVCLIFGVGVMLTLVKRLSTCSPVNTDRSFAGNIVIIVGVLFQQGISSCSSRIPERMVLLFGLVVGVMIVLFYNSMIVTSLLHPPPKYISTPQHLLDSPFQLGIQNHAYVRHYFETSPDPIVRTIYDKRLNRGTGIVKPREGVKLMQKSKFAYFAEEVPVYNLIDKTFSNEAICSLQEIELERNSHMYLPVRRNSPLTEFFNQAVLMMKETGIMQGQTNRWYSRKPLCQGHLSIPSVELQSLSIAYCILAAGVTTSLFLLLVELAYAKWGKERGHKTNDCINQSIPTFKI